MVLRPGIRQGTDQRECSGEPKAFIRSAGIGVDQDVRDVVAVLSFGKRDDIVAVDPGRTEVEQDPGVALDHIELRGCFTKLAADALQGIIQRVDPGGLK
ncbi:hypothetical protein D3C78_1731980 [compost metagenome]